MYAGKIDRSWNKACPRDSGKCVKLTFLSDRGRERKREKEKKFYF
jgi:hypothetical protein